MAYRQPAGLAKIGRDGFDIIDKCYGRPNMSGRLAPPPGYPHGNNTYEGSELPHSQTFCLIDREANTTTDEDA
jgi:hypothetical protein